MACIPLPTIELPKLPFPLSISPPELPDISVSLALCCKLPTLHLPIPPIPIPPLILKPGVVALITAAQVVIDSFLDSLPLDCPFD